MKPCRSSLVLAWTGLVIAGCGSSPGARSDDAGDPDHDRDRVVVDASRKGAVIVVTNPTRDTWDLSVGGAPRGSVAPGSEAQLLGIPRGRQTVVATNDHLGLSQRASVDAAAGRPASVVLKPMVGRLRVTNPLAEAVEIVVDGASIGDVAAAGERTFDGVPAGKRTLMFKGTSGPGAVRIDNVLPPDGEVALTVPDLSSEVIDPKAPHAPEGKGMVRMRNASQNAVTLIADGKDYGIVPAGALFDLVLEPGTHTLEVHIAGIDARTEHRVTLLPNQVAEWRWSAD